MAAAYTNFNPVPGDPGQSDHSGTPGTSQPGDPEYYEQQKPEVSFTKKVEILRALLVTAKQYNQEYTGSGGIEVKNGETPFIGMGAQNQTRLTTGSEVKPIDREMMESFKKLFQLGKDNAKKFPDVLDDAFGEGGDVLDAYSVLYYLSQWRTTPLSNYKDLDLDAYNRVWTPGPDIMGVNANVAPTNSSTPVFKGVAADVPDVTLNKCPSILIKLLATGKGSSQGLFSSNISSAIAENTLPFIDKRNDQRIEQEPEAGWNKVNPVHGNLMVKDIEKNEIQKGVAQDILDEIENYLGDKPFQLYLFRKFINYFNPAINNCWSWGDYVVREVSYMKQTFEDVPKQYQNLPPEMQKAKQNGTGTEIIEKKKAKVATDMFGHTFDSVESVSSDIIGRRSFELRTSGGDGPQNKKFKLYTVKGELGSGIDPEADEMTGCETSDE
tara:strand:- start:7173 stop:8489 length:1317 start_codon:yes stop_codon:yes gene_type:complete